MTTTAAANLFSLEGRTALITGGSRGLGREMALAFARAGANVVVASRKLDSCVGTVREIESLGRSALAHVCHVGAWDELERLVDAAYARFGRIDVLVNNAGMSPLYPSLDRVSEALWDKVLAVNLKGPFRLSALVASRMQKDGGGSIINVSSIAAERPTPTETPYAAAKAGLNAITIAFAQAYGPKVRVNAIQAGPFLTDISKAWPPEIETFLSARAALGRAGRPDEIVGTALYLASDASTFTTGAIIRVDGGQK